MSHRIMLIPVSTGVGLTSTSVGLVRALEQKTVKVNFFKPIAQPRSSDKGPEKSAEIVKKGSLIQPPPSFDLSYAEKIISAGRANLLLEEVVSRFEQYITKGDVAIIEGMVPTRKQPYAGRVNREIAQALGAEIIFVITPGNDTTAQLEEKLEIASGNYGGVRHQRVLGCIFNKVNAPVDEEGRVRAELVEQFDTDKLEGEQHRLASLPLFSNNQFKLLGSVPWNFDLVAPRVMDLVKYLDAKIINEGDLKHRRLRRIAFCARTVSNMLSHFTLGILLVTPGDRTDILIAACLSAMNGTKLGAILLTGGFKPESSIMKLCEQAMQTGLPIISTKTDTWRTSLLLHNFNMEVPADDEQRIEKVKDHNAAYLDADWLKSLTHGVTTNRKMSPPAFRHLLASKAKKSQKTIVLPEGEEPRTVKAAAICGERNIAKTILLGDKKEIFRIAAQQGVQLDENVTVISPDEVRENYIEIMVELRKSKGLTNVVAAEQLADIAIQSADSAAFGIEPKVAMISYSTSNSGVGADVEKVKLATEIAQSKRPDLIIDGPLQYDAAIMENVAFKKAPNSPVAGQATVFIFPILILVTQLTKRCKEVLT